MDTPNGATSPRVVITGAGIGGLTAAIALRQRGIAASIYERSTELADVGAGISLWPNALKALYQLGLKSALDRISFITSDGALRRADGTVLTRTSARELVTRFGTAVTVFHRAELLDVLVNAARGIPIHLGHECRGFEQRRDGVTIQFAGDRQVEADVLVAADGLRSVMRRQLGIPGELRYSGYTAWRGIAPFPSSRALAGESLGRGQRFGLVPIAGDRVYWYATDNVPEGQRESPAEAKARLRALFSSWHDPIPAVIDATDAGAILRNDIYDRDPAASWGAGRVTLLGDAAHPMTPNLGQGACQAIEDAMVLARSLGAGGDLDTALRRYESARIPRTRAIVLASRRVGSAFQIESRVVCALRDAVMRMMPAAAAYRNLASIAGFEGHLKEVEANGSNNGAPKPPK